jgi:hypothetical protein
MKLDLSSLRTLSETFSFTILLLFMIYEKVKDRIKVKEYNNLTLFLKKNEQIQEKLTEVRVVLGADRVKLFQFHNGDHYINGDSALKCSITHLSLKAGVSYPQNALSCYSNIIISSLAQYIPPVIKDNDFFSKVDDLQDDDWKKIKALNGTKTVLIKRVGSEPHIGGFVMITWHDEVSKPNSEQIHVIEKTLDSLSLILRSRK